MKTLKTITKLTISRAKWRRGGRGNTGGFGLGPTKLLNHEGFMCCLGFFTLACGAAPEDILSKGIPIYTNLVIPQLITTPLLQELLNANDSTTLTEAAREESIAKQMLQLAPPVVVTFTD